MKVMFNKKSKFLKILYRKNKFYQQHIVKGRDVELELNLNYKQTHNIASYWEKQGCVMSRSERGGNLEYQITSIGELTCEKINKQEKRVKIIFLGIFFIFVLYFFV